MNFAYIQYIVLYSLHCGKSQKTRVVFQEVHMYFKKCICQVSFGLDAPDGSFFNKPWVRVDGVVSAMAAPVAYEKYLSLSAER